MRRIKYKLLKYTSSIPGLAIILSIPLWVFFLINFSRFELIVVDEGVTDKTTYTLWADFNGDDISDNVQCYEWTDGFYSFPFRTIEGEVSQQINISGKPGKYLQEAAFTGDYDGNSLDELYVLLHRNDSLFLNVIEPYGKGHFVRDQFIEKVKSGKAGYDYSIRATQLYDTDLDGHKEYIFMVSAGFSIHPRALFVYNLTSNTLKKTGHLGTNVHNFKISDLNSDGKPEYSISSFASSNMRDTTIAYHDHSAYIFILDENLKPLFPVREFKGATRFIRTFPIQFGEKHYYCVFHKCDARFKEVGYYFYLLDTAGTCVKKRSYKHKNKEDYLSMLPQVQNGKHGVLILKGNNTVYTINESLDLIKITDCEERVGYLGNIDMNQDGDIEKVFISREGRYLYVYNDKIRNPIKTQIKCIPQVMKYALVKGKYKNPSLYLRCGNQWFDIIYHQIHYYHLKILGALSGIYMVLWMFVFFIQKMTATRDLRRKKMAELQLTSWKNQLDPHFTFNTLNSVGAVILSEERYEAYDFFTKFTKLMRHALESSSKVSVSLDQELKFIELYLQLERFRFKNRFSYSIVVADDVNVRIQIPKMLMQTYVENAVRHGLLDRELGGELLIKIYKTGKNTVFQIEDNGVGRKVSSQKENLGNGVGMKLMKAYFRLLNSVNDKTIKLRILDRNENEIEYPGTIVYIILPDGFSFKL